MDMCHLKNAELEAKHHKYKGRLVLRTDSVEDDSGSYAVFTEQGSSASQMISTKMMDIISRLPGCDGQAADAASVFAQVKYGRCSEKKIPSLNIQTFGFVHHDTNVPNHGPVWKTQSFLLSEICTVILWQDYDGKSKILLKHGWGKVPNWECLFVHSEKGLFLSVYVDEIKLAGSKQNMNPMWKVLNKEVDLGEPTSFLDHVYLGCTERQCEIRKIRWTITEPCLNREFLTVEKLPFPQNLRISSWSYDMAGHAKKCVERYCELANKTTQQLYKVSTPCIDDNHLKRKK